MIRLLTFFIIILFGFPLVAKAEFATNLTNLTVQCWGCPVFDHLFIIVSQASGKFYNIFANTAFIIMILGLVAYITYIVLKNLKTIDSAKTYIKKLFPTFINVMLVSIFLSMGTSFPKLFSEIVFVPITEITKIYSNGVIQTPTEQVNIKVKYEPAAFPTDEATFYSPKLRDGVIDLMKNNTAFFQNLMLLGMASIDSSFSLKSLSSIEEFGKSIATLILGFIMIYIFFQLFVKFCFYFIDIILDLTIFAFFFPFILVGWVFQLAEDTPAIFQGLGNTGTIMIKNIIKSIITLVVVIIVYVIAFYMIGFFLGDYQGDSTGIIGNIITGNYKEAVEQIEFISIDGGLINKLLSFIILGYLINFFIQEIPKIVNKLTTEFGASETRTKNAETVYNELKTKTLNAIEVARKFMKDRKAKK